MKCRPPKFWPQYLVTFLCNVGTLTFGIHAGWLAPLHLRFTSENSPLGRDRPLTTEQISWIGSIPSVSFFLGTAVYGFLLQRIGRRVSAFYAVVPNVLCFLVLAFAYDVYTIYFARFVAGFAAAGSLLIAPVYVNESTGEEVRGFLCGLSAFFVNAGLVISATAGGYLPYWLFNAVCSSFSLIFLVFYCWLPETPVYLIIKGRNKEAGEVLRKLKWGSKTDVIRLRSEFENRGAPCNSLKQLLSDRAFVYGLFLAVGVMTVHQMSGCTAITTYSAKVFRDAGSDLPPAVASTVTGAILLLGSVLGAYLLVRAGRKSILAISLALMAVDLSVLSAFTYLRHKIPNGFGWVPSATLFTYLGTFTSGIGSVSFVLITELFQPEVRGISGSICGTWASILGFLTAKFFPVIVEEVSLPPVLAAFAVCCAAGAVFSRCLLIETRGKTPNQVAESLRGRPVTEEIEVTASVRKLTRCSDGHEQNTTIKTL